MPPEETKGPSGPPPGEGRPVLGADELAEGFGPSDLELALVVLEIDLQFHGPASKEGTWRAFQGMNCGKSIDGDLYEAWGASPTEAVLNLMTLLQELGSSPLGSEAPRL